MILRYLDETGLSLALPPAQTWTVVGQAYQFKVPTRWSSVGRVNLMGSLRCFGDRKLLEYRMVDGRCTSQVLECYLDSLADQTCSERPTVVVLDNAGSHTARRIKSQIERWAAKGLRLYYLPPYCPHLNLVERWWKDLKGFMMPRRYYDSLAQLKEALFSALDSIEAIKL